MKVLFDQGTPVPLRRHLRPHEVDTAAELGWSTLKNGDLLDQAEVGGYEALVTTDQHLRHRQRLEGRKIRVVTHDHVLAQDAEACCGDPESSERPPRGWLC